VDGVAISIEDLDVKIWIIRSESRRSPLLDGPSRVGRSLVRVRIDILDSFGVTGHESDMEPFDPEDLLGDPAGRPLPHQLLGPDTVIGHKA
jgi:hypothetical protein